MLTSGSLFSEALTPPVCLAGRADSPAGSMDIDDDERVGLDAQAAEPSNADQYDPAEEVSGAYRSIPLLCLLIDVSDPAYGLYGLSPD